MGALSLGSLESSRSHFIFKPKPITLHHLNRLFYRRRSFQPFSISFIFPNFMGDHESRDSVITQFDCTDDGRAIEAVSPKYAEIIVIRHGETEWNACRRIQEHLDVDLNDVGRQQAVAVADRLSREPKISAVYSSDLKRAFDTAEVIAKRCGVLEVTKDAGLRERHLGDLQGVVFHEAAKVNPVTHKSFVSNQEDEEIPGGGESFKQLFERCTSALDMIAKKYKGSGFLKFDTIRKS